MSDYREEFERRRPIEDGILQDARRLSNVIGYELTASFLEALSDIYYQRAKVIRSPITRHRYYDDQSLAAFKWDL